MNNYNVQNILKLSTLLILTKGADLSDDEDGVVATVDISSLLYLEEALLEVFETGSDNLDNTSVDLIFKRINNLETNFIKEG